ncbi:MAG: sulfatase-like hydrolase/transferase [Verrucomicrobiaceae bacterium]|nr:sulfatase-like hydrolase/transferase [Verrucomicrobiaceae bacterium]
MKCFFLALACCLATSFAPAANNILLIIADDMGIDASAVYNPTGNVAPTPNIASLASNGIKFTNAYAYPLCSPTRSAILTGRQGFRTGTANVAGGASSNNALKSTEFTLPDAFTANAGLQYQLKHVGKWHLGAANTSPTLIGGWPSFDGAMVGEVADYYAWTKVSATGASASSTTSTTYATTDNVNDAVSFISTQTGAAKPWFLWLAFNAPHIPYHKPPTSLLTTAGSIALSGTTTDINANPRNYFNAMIEAMDTEIGRLLASVNLSNTTVIFVGDNGTEQNVLQSPYPANRGKATLYEGGIRVPLIIRGPDVVSPGRTSTQLVHLCDLYSTILELAGINVATTTAGVTLDSKSLLPVIQNSTGTRTQVFDEYWDLAFPTLANTGRSIRDSQYKLIRLATGTDLFYDLNADPYEATNLVGSMNATQTTAYNNLVAQLASYNTAPTIGSVANRAVAQGTSTGSISFTVGDGELNPTILSVSGTSSNTTLVPNANIVLGGSGTSRTVTVTPASGQNGSATITLAVTDGVFTTNTSFVLSVGQPASVNGVTQSPSSPTNTDAVTVTANVLPGGGATLSSVNLQYSTGAQTTSTVWRETFSSGSTTSGLAGANNAWTATAVRNAQDVKQRGSTGNNTAPITLTNVTTSGTTTVTCASTAGLWPGMLISGTNMPTNATISSVTNATTFVVSSAATGSGSGLSLTAAGITLTGCSLGTSPTINTASTTSLAVGMGISGAGLTTNPPNTSVSAVTNATSFTVNSTVTAVPTTLTASGCGLDFSIGTSTYTDTMATITNAINASAASAGGIDFYVRNADMVSNNGWTFQVSPDGGTTWNTRLSENFSAASATNCTLNATTTVACSNTSGLTVGNSVQGNTVTLANCTTNATTTIGCSNTTGLVVGMFVTGGANAGIANNTRITAITANTNITVNTAPTSTGTFTLLANYMTANATITAINPNVSFTVSSAPFVSGSGITLASINHGFQLKHYDFTAGELTSNLKFRFQWSGSTATQPARNPTCDIDDISVSLTTGAPPQTIAMFDDGLHGDGAAGDGVYGATIPQQAAGTNVSYTITATDSLGGTATGTGSYTVAAAAPVLAVTPATTFSSSGAVGSGSYSPSSASYTLSNTGTGTMSWTAAKTAAWLDLSATSGTLAAGATTTVTASINATNANSLAAATYNDTITFTNAYNGTGNTTRSASLLITNGVPTAPATPTITTVTPYSAGNSKWILWPSLATATSYTIQIATDSGFTQNVVSQTVTTPYATFANLTHGVTYYYRVLATNNVGSSSFSTVVSSTQDAVAPTVAISSPASGGTQTATTITVTGTASDALSGISAVKVNNVNATVTGNTWTATIPLGFGTNAITATAFDGAGNTKTSSAITVLMTTAQTYNPLMIPDIITGTQFDLELLQTSKKFPALPDSTTTLGTNATTTLGYNGALMWGPTLIMNKGDYVQLNVKNSLDQSTSPLLRTTTTTVHWHGLHIPAIMDGGPRQVIPGGTTWSPSWTVMNDAATYWYHPHLHVATQEQLTLGAGGFLIVRDPQEASLGLPRTYGVDDIPLALTSRRYLRATNQFSFNQYAENTGTTSSLDNYGDTILINGTHLPQVSLPKQFVRLRILNGEIQRGYNLGFSDNRTYYVIANDQGLLNAPVAVTRMFLMVGERVEILVDMRNDTASFDLKAYNTGQVFGFPSQEGPVGGTAPTGNAGPENGSRLNNSDFNLLHINPVAATSGAITTLPTTLANNTYLTAANATNTRTITVNGGNPSTVNGLTTSTGFTFNNISYSPNVMNHTIPLNAIERWNISAGNIFGHSLHIHDIKFKIIERYSTAPGTAGSQVTSNGLAAGYESGWKDTVYIPRAEGVSVVMKFDDFASNVNPYMFHCHFMNHEDGGMMGQFLVVNNAVEDLAVASFTRYGSNNQIDLDFKATPGTTYTLQYSTDLSTWTTIGSVTSDGNSAGFTETDGTRLGQSKGFYRVVLPTAPTAPAITSATTATGTVGAAFNYQITATNNPTSFIVVGLPAGLSYNASTGLISGTPTTAATSNVTFTATNAGGTGEGHVVLTVN